MTEYQYMMQGVEAGISAGVYIVSLIISLALSIFLIICLWRIFDKADEPGWASLIPFYNTYVMFKLSMGNGWLFLLCFIPIVNIIISIWLYFALAKVFDRGVGFGFGLLFLPIIFFPILAFGDAEYVGR